MRVKIEAAPRTWERIADALDRQATIYEALNLDDIREEQFLRMVAGQISAEVREQRELKQAELEAKNGTHHS